MSRPNWKEQLAAFPVWLEDLRHGNHVPVTGWYAEFADHFKCANGFEVTKLHESWAFKVWRKPQRPSHYPKSFPVWVCDLDGNNGDWYRNEGDLLRNQHGQALDKARDGVTWMAIYPETQLALEAPAPSAWGGQDYPPVGTVCDLRVKTGGWGLAEIKYMSTTVCVWLWIREAGGEQVVEWAEAPCRMEFRPVRTPEQIAVESRDKAVSAMWAVLNARLPERYRTFDGEALRSALGILHNTGHRKAPGYVELLEFAEWVIAVAENESLLVVKARKAIGKVVAGVRGAQ